MQTIIMVQCCICGKVLGFKDGFGVEGISHTYCKECGEKEIEKVRVLASQLNGHSSMEG